VSTGLPTGDSPIRQEGALGPYLRAIGAHRLLVVAVTLATVAASAAWLSLRDPTYEATAQLLVSPLPQDDTTFIGVQVLRESTEPTRTMQTAATLVSSREAARLTAARLGRGWTAERVEDSVDVDPQGESNILAVTAQADARGVAARVANLYAAAALEARRATLRRQVDAAIRQLRAGARAPGNSAGAAADRAERLNQLELVRRGVDPTLSLSQPASVPSAPLGPPAFLVVAVSAIAGFTLASGAALLLEVVDRRVRNEEEIVELYPLPVLARVPRQPRRLRGRGPPTVGRMPAAAGEAFRGVQAHLDRKWDSGPCAILMTSASTGDGKTTSSANLAVSMVLSGHRVLLVDFDFRRPGLGRFLGLTPDEGVPLLTSEVPLRELVVSVPGTPLPLGVLPASPRYDIPFDELHASRVPERLAQAKELADYVILDGPALGEAGDALGLVGEVDEVIVVARPGHTDRVSLARTRDLLGRAGRTPAGFLLVGRSRGAPTARHDPIVLGRVE
jgi:Mrp family chromosome partitioning ATPase